MTRWMLDCTASWSTPWRFLPFFRSRRCLRPSAVYPSAWMRTCPPGPALAAGEGDGRRIVRTGPSGAPARAGAGAGLDSECASTSASTSGSASGAVSASAAVCASAAGASGSSSVSGSSCSASTSKGSPPSSPSIAVHGLRLLRLLRLFAGLRLDRLLAFPTGCGLGTLRLRRRLLRLRLDHLGPPASATAARARGGLLQGRADRVRGVRVTRSALALHLGEHLGHLPVRDHRVLVGHGNPHLPQERDQRVGFDPKIIG